MVYFMCDECGESLKKSQVQRHTYKCRSNQYSCIDCQVVFDKQSYNDHIKCISENQKYGGANYVAKENKGEVKQNQWIDQVNEAIKSVKDPQLSRLLKTIQGYTNIPRKETKFLNFISNSLRSNRDSNLAKRAWLAIEEATQRLKEAEKKRRLADEETQMALKLIDGEKLANQEEKSSESEQNNNNNVNGGDTIYKDETEKDEKTPKKSNFKWKVAIKRKLKESEDGQIKMKKLRTEVIKEFQSALEPLEIEQLNMNEVKEIFEKKLLAAGVQIDGKIVSLK